MLSDELPWVTGSIGLLGTRPSYEMMRDCDTLLTVGSSFPYTQFMPELDQARAVQIDLDGTLIGMRYPYEVNLVGDAAATLRALIPLLHRKEDRAWREALEPKVARLVGGDGRRGAGRRRPGQPDADLQRVLRAARPPTRSITADSGSAANWYARQVRMRGDDARLAVRAPWPPWGRPSPTPSAPSSPTPTGPRSPSRATAPCR